MAFIDSVYERARSKKKSVAIPECTNELMMRACVRATADGLADIVFVGKADEIEGVRANLGLDLTGIKIVDTNDSDYVEQLLDRYEALPSKAMGRKSVARRISSPLYMAFVMQAVGDVDSTFGGLDTTTMDFVMAASGIIGLTEGCLTPSSLMIHEIEGFEGSQGNCIGMSDGAICVDPTSEQLASIAISCCETFEALVGREASCALLSYSTCGSGSSPSVERIQRAVALAQQQRPSYKIDGEFQADSAVVKRVAEKKVKRESEVAGRANVLIFPDAAACNIASKLTQIFANQRSYGPVYQGFRLPVLDCSRGATEQMLYDNVAMCSVMAAYQLAE